MIIIQTNSIKPSTVLNLDIYSFIGCLYRYRVSETYAIILDIAKSEQYIIFTVLTNEGKLDTFPAIKDYLEIFNNDFISR
jgi:hypothetical protein